MSFGDELMKLEELRRSGTLSEDEFAKAKAALINGASAAPEQELGGQMAAQLAEVRHQNEVARIDREWEIEQQQYLVRGRYGNASVPTPAMGIGMAVIGGVFGLFWTIMAVGITGGAPDDGPFGIAKIFFPLFGVVFIVAVVGGGIYTFSRAQKYQEAFAAYKARRARAEDGRPVPDRPRERGESPHNIKPG
jgi:hypothetical protein